MQTDEQRLRKLLDSARQEIASAKISRNSIMNGSLNDIGRMGNELERAEKRVADAVDLVQKIWGNDVADQERGRG